MSLFTSKKETPAPEFTGLDAASTADAPVATATDAIPAEKKALVSDFKSQLPVPQAAISPEVVGYLNLAISEAVASALKALAPTLVEVAKSARLTRDELVTLSGRDVEKEKSFADRLLRERMEWRKQNEEAARQKEILQNQCTHKDANGKLSFSPISNYPDRQKRFVCVKCHALVHPREWRIDPPEPRTGREMSHLEPAHKLYDDVLKTLASEGKLV